MDQSDFSILIGRLERQAEERPQFYAAKVGFVAALGYAGLALVGLCILVACYFMVATAIARGRPSGWMVLIGFAAAGTLVAMVRALWVRIEPPKGRRITSEEAPDLFALINATAGKLNVQPLESVTIDSEFNASIRQIPQWGVFGNYRNHLQLGVPLLAALDVDEFTAVLAHEMGHLSDQHGRFSAWIYRQRVAWHALEQRFAEPSNFFEEALARFYGWYAPYFHAYTFVLARNQEYIADRASAQIADAQAAGRALTKLTLMSRFLSDVFWERFFAHVEKLPEPPYRPYSMMQRAFKVAEKQWSRSEWLKEALSRYAADDDTHPSLAERLAALDVTPALPTYEIETSALTLFGPEAAALIDHCDDEWRTDNVSAWRKRHDEIKEAHWNIAEYEKYEDNQLRPEDLWAKAHLYFTVSREADGIATLASLAARKEPFPKAPMLLGQMLLERGDERGLKYLIAAVGQDAGLADAAGAVGYSYLVKRGRKGEAQRFWERISESTAA